jgi:hypothetical protein
MLVSSNPGPRLVNNMEDESMKEGFGRSAHNILSLLLSVLAATSLLFCTGAGASVYDDFGSTGMDTSKWTISDPQGLFSQPGDGQLYFNSNNEAGTDPAPRGGLASTVPFAAGFFSMDFNQFLSTNTSPGGLGLGSFAALGLGTRETRYVRMLRGRVVSENWGYFEANYFDGTDLHVWYVFTDVTSGQLGLNYDASTVSFFYHNGSGGWQRLDTTGPDTKGKTVTVSPGWSSPPPLFISGTPGGTGITQFAVDKVEYTTVPEPASIVLFGSGLVGIFGLWKKKQKK